MFIFPNKHSFFNVRNIILLSFFGVALGKKKSPFLNKESHYNCKRKDGDLISRGNLVKPNSRGN